MRCVQRQKANRRTGATILEAAVVLPVFLLFVIGIFEYGRFLMVRNVMDNAAREGARYAVVHTLDKQPSDVIQQVQNFLGNLGPQLQGLAISVNYIDSSTGVVKGDFTDAPFGDAVSVQITGNYLPALAGFLGMPSSIAFSATSVMRSEAN